MRILHWYYLRELTISFLITFGLIFSVALLVAVGRMTYHSAGLDFILVLAGVLLWSVEPLPHLVSVALTIAVVLTASRATADNEILAVRMGGIQILHVLLPAVLLGILLATINSFLINDVIQAVNQWKRRLPADVATRFFQTTNPVNNLINLSDFRMLWRTKEEDRFLDVWVDMKKVGMCGFAEEVEIRPPVGGKVQVSFKHFRGLHDPGGARESLQEGEVIRGFADQVDLEIDMASLVIGRHPSRNRFGLMRSRQIVADLRTGRSWDPDQALHTLHSRKCLALTALFFALTGFPIGVLFQRGGRTGAFGVALVPLVVFYATAYLGQVVAGPAGHPLLGAWLPAGVLSVMAVALNWKVFRR